MKKLMCILALAHALHSLSWLSLRNQRRLNSRRRLAGPCSGTFQFCPQSRRSFGRSIQSSGMRSKALEEASTSSPITDGNPHFL